MQPRVEKNRSPQLDRTTPAPAPTSVGFVGVGNLGSHLARSLLRAGYPLTVTDLDRGNAHELLAAGAVWADTPRAAAEGSDCVITCLPTPTAVTHCMTADDGVLAGLRAGGTWIDMSTNDAAEVQRIAGLAADQGVRSLECPVTGGVHAAAVGRITALVGGDAACLKEHHALLAAMTDPVIHVGGLGQASTLKVVTNMLAFVNQWAAGEALMLARVAGIDLGRAYEGIRHSSGNSWSLEVETQLVLSGSYDFRFSLDLACKDLGLAHGLGHTLGVPLEIAGHVEQIFRRAHAEYGGDASSTRVVQLIEETMGLQLRADGFPTSLFGHAGPGPDQTQSDPRPLNAAAPGSGGRRLASG